MNTDRLTDAMNGIADDKLVKAHEPVTVKKQKSTVWIRVAAIAAAACLVVVFLIFTVGKTDGDIVYADEFDQRELLMWNAGSRVTVSDGIKKLSGNSLVRVAIAIHMDSSAYPENGFSWSRDDVTWDDYLKFCDYVMGCETEFLQGTGAEDIERLGRDVVACTMSVRDIAKLDKGKNTYTVVLFTARNSDYHEGGSRDINSHDGEYKCVMLVNISPFSSFYPPEQFVESGHLIIKDGKATLEFTNSYDSDFYHILYEDCECVPIENKQFDEMLDLLNSNVIFDELKYAARSTYELKNGTGTVRLCLTDSGRIFVDLGSWGIYLFE